MKKLSALLFLILISQMSLAQKTVTLQDCESQFLKNNLFLLASQYNIDASKALTIQARIWDNPTITAQLNAYNPQRNQYFDIGKDGQKAFGIEQLIYLGGKKRNEIQLSQTNEQLAELPMSTSLPESVQTAAIIRKDLESFPEVKKVLSQTGRSNDGTDPNGFGFIQLQVDLKPKSEWTRKISMDDLINEMDTKLKVHQGITYNYSQPVIDNVAESVAGFKASNAVKIYGDDLDKLDELSNEVLAKIKNIPGIKDAGILRNVGQPEISVILDREKMAAYGVTLSDAQAVLELAFGGKTATQKYEDEKKFDVRVRFSKEYRKDEEDLAELKVPTISGVKIPFKEIYDLKTVTGPAFIYRDNTKRFIGVKFSVRDRDLGSTIAEAQQKVTEIKMPTGYTTGWTGEFENQVRASARLAQVVPISLLGIFVLLFILFGNIKDSLLVLANVPFAIIGGILALHITGMNFGISAGVGFIALLGICIQNGVILISEFHHNLKAKFSLEESIFMGVKARTRAVIMTALMASIGLMPAAISTGIGSESQKPLAIVIIGGLVTATILTLLVFPIIFWVFNRKNMLELSRRFEIS